VSATDSVGNAVTNTSAGLVAITAPSTGTPPAEVVALPGTGGLPSREASETVRTSPSAALGDAPAAVASSTVALGLPVDRYVDPSQLGVRASAGEILRPAPAFDFNSLPATAAGPLDPFGFPLERMPMGQANDFIRGQGGLPLIGHYLFEYRGIAELSADGRVPQDAFAHTDPAAVVHLSARLADGSMLPAWLRLDGRGAFTGLPPEDLEGKLEVEVVARDSEGREAHTTFSLELDALRAAAAAKDSVLGLDVDADEAKRAKLEAARQAEKAAREQAGKAKGTATFSEQVRVAKGKADPLLDRILGKGQDKPRAPR
jgi:hypothetical protein